jgi:putative glutamine amidotransferase
MNDTTTTPARTPRPVVLIPACNRIYGHHVYHMAGKKYADAVRLAGCQPLIVPSATPEELEALLEFAHGVLLTGSPSNVHPSHFAEEVLDPSLPLDPDRDAWTLPLVPKAIARGMPLFAICRGFQEVNVALGGSLHQAVHKVAGFNDHREDEELPVDEQYGPAHEVFVEPGGLLASIVEEPKFIVNSLHGQGVNRLAPGLRVEARAPDGLVEAFSVQDGDHGFLLGVQWHPEWLACDNPISCQMFKAFGEAARAYRDQQETPEPHT